MNLEKEINALKERNARVEAEKSWETSWMRRILIFALTYLVVLTFFLISKLPDPFLNSLVPALAFLLATSAIKPAKKILLEKYKK